MTATAILLRNRAMIFGLAFFVVTITPVALIASRPVAASCCGPRCSRLCLSFKEKNSSAAPYIGPSPSAAAS
jgi:hypothetical protein